MCCQQWPRSQVFDTALERCHLAGRKRTGPPKDIKKTVAAKFGIHLEQLVNASGMTVAEFAEKIGKSDQAVWGYFRAKSTPHLNDWGRIGKALGLKNVRDLAPDITI